MTTSDAIEKILSKLTLEEKAALCTGASSWTSVPVERLGVPPIFVADGPHGLRREVPDGGISAGSLPSTCFPTASLLAATWDVDLIREMGNAIAEEALAQNVDVVLGPGANMKRSPLGGRNFEYYSEDPFLAGEMAAAFINGVQSRGVGTSLKHFAANNQEFQRFTISAEIDERTLRETYLAAFEKAVKTAHPWTVMCSYNKVNGTLVSQNTHLLKEILKEEWGFEGVIVSDWGAVRDRVAALKAGLDWQMPGPVPHHVQSVVDAVNNGSLAMSVLDESVRRILRLVFKAQQTSKGGTFNADQHHELAHRIACEGMVLLKNNGILPLKGGEMIAVIGHSAENAHFQGGGSSHINPTRVANPLLELKKISPDAEFSFCEGYPSDDSGRPEMIQEAVTLALNANVALLFIALPTFKESEGYDRTDMQLTDQQINLIRAVSQAQPNTVVILNNGSPVTMTPWIDGVAAVLESYMMGQAGGAAIADILLGKVNPCGKLAETFPLRLEDTPAYLNWPGDAGSVTYGEGMYIGYRYYDARNMPVAFPFGFGLSYTTFEYKNPSLAKTTFKDIDGVKVSVDVTNTGSLAGKEIVQVYVHDHQSTLHRPQKELKGFAKLELKPGETKRVTIPLDFRAFTFYHPEHKQWITEEGKFDILIGASATDIRHTLTATLESTLNLPCILDNESTLNEWMSDRHGRQVLEPLYEMMVAELRQRFTGQDASQQSAEVGAAMGMNDVMDMMVDMPLVSILHWGPQIWGKTPEEMVDELLLKVKSL